MDNLTASEIAGFGVGTLLLCATIAAPKIDSFISSSQRSSLGMCKRCGDLKLIACSDCRGVGSVKSEGLIRSGVFLDLYESVFGEELGGKIVACSKCRDHMVLNELSNAFHASHLALSVGMKNPDLPA